MEIDKITVQSIHPDPIQSRMQGTVTIVFNRHSAAGGPSDSRAASFSCSCKIPDAAESHQRMSQMKMALVADATRQAAGLTWQDRP